MKTTKKLALVTGASGGIGEATARLLLEAGYAVACGYHAHAERVRALGAHPDAFAVRIDISRRQSVKAALKAVERHFGRSVDIIINNAGIIDETPFEKITDAQWDRMLQVNLRGAFFILQETIGHMRKKRWGRVINVASIGGQWGGMKQVHYAAAKAGLINLTHSIAKLYARDGITSNAVSPGLVDTPMIRNELRSKEGKRKLSALPLGRIAKPGEVAAAIVFLCSKDAAYITGQTLNINGGMLLS